MLNATAGMNAKSRLWETLYSESPGFNKFKETYRLKET